MRVAIAHEIGLLTTVTRPSRIASQMAVGSGSASTSEYVVPSWTRR